MVPSHVSRWLLEKWISYRSQGRPKLSKFSLTMRPGRQLWFIVLLVKFCFLVHKLPNHLKTDWPVNMSWKLEILIFYRSPMVIIWITKHGLILFVHVHVLIQMLIEHVVQPMHRTVPEVINFIFPIIFTYFHWSKIEFTQVVGSPSPPNLLQDQIIPTTLTLSPTHSSSSINICMMCNSRSHEDSKITMQKDFCYIKSLSSRLIVNIHAEEIEKQLLRYYSFDIFYSLWN